MSADNQALLSGAIRFLQQLLMFGSIWHIFTQHLAHTGARARVGLGVSDKRPHSGRFQVRAAMTGRQIHPHLWHFGGI